MTPSLSLESWRRVFGFHPWHFWGMADDDVIRVTADCPTVVKQYAWQGVDAAGRAEIVEAIERAEQILLEYLRFRPGAQYTEATLPWPQPGDRRLGRLTYADPQGRWLNIPLPEAHVQAVGTEAQTLIGAAAVVYTDPQSRGVDTLATITIATAVTDPAELAAFFQTADGGGRIRPLTVTIVAGVATLTGPAYLFVRPVNYETISPEANDIDLDPADPGVLASTVDIYRVYTETAGITNATAQGLIIWETTPWHGWWCCCNQCSGASFGSPNDPDAIAQAVARVGIRDAERGVVTPAASLYDSGAGTWAAFPWSGCPSPSRVTVRYLAGVPLVNGDMDPTWATVVARLAAAELARPICACQEANRELARWQFDVAIQSEVESYQVSAEDLFCPWGTRRGHIQAWRFVQRMERVRGFTE